MSCIRRYIYKQSRAKELFSLRRHDDGKMWWKMRIATFLRVNRRNVHHTLRKAEIRKEEGVRYYIQCKHWISTKSQQSLFCNHVDLTKWKGMDNIMIFFFEWQTIWYKMKKVIEEAFWKNGNDITSNDIGIWPQLWSRISFVIFLEAALLHLCTFISLFYFIHFSYKIEL